MPLPDRRRPRRAALLVGALLGGLLLGATALVAPPALAGGPVSSEDVLPEPEHSPEEADQQADDILDRDEFKEAEPGPVERAQQWVEERIVEAITKAGEGGAFGVLGWIVLILLVAGVLFLVLRLLRTVQRDAATDVELDVEHSRTPKEWADLAAEAEAEGEWKEGLRCRYRGLVADLIAAEVLDDVPGRTTGEHRVEVAEEAPDAAVPFSAAAELFDRAWYGDRPTGPEQAQVFAEQAQQAVAAARRRGRRPVDELQPA